MTGMMGCVYGWLEEMRAPVTSFLSTSLLLHSDHLLSVADDLDLTEAPGRRDVCISLCPGVSPLRNGEWLLIAWSV